MMTFIRLKPYDRTKGHTIKTYVSPSGRVYSAGQFGQPSPLFEVGSKEEVAYIRSLNCDQFEVVVCADRAAASELIQKEMEARALEGLAAVRAPMVPESKKEDPDPKAKSAPRLAPVGDEGDEGKENADGKGPADDEKDGKKPEEPKGKGPRGAKAKESSEDGKK